MKGLDVARDFFFNWGQPFVEENFPQLTGRYAAGRLSGSDVIGGDDEISRDHNWGPQFRLFLTDLDYQKYAESLESVVNAAAPNPWKTYRLAGGGDKSVFVDNISQWFMRNFRLAHPPRTPSEWVGLSESALYFHRHGAIWVDGLGEMEAWRSALRYYPREILLGRLGVESFRIWQHGEYNFVQRMARRRDPLAISACLGQFVDAVMRIALLLDNDFTPYWKWLAFAMRKTSEAGLYVPLLEQLVASREIEEQVDLVRTVCGHVHNRLVQSGAVSGAPGNPWLLPLFKDHRELVEASEKSGLVNYSYTP